jgi:hypothetical protein
MQAAALLARNRFAVQTHTVGRQSSTPIDSNKECTMMKRLFATLLAVSAIGLGSLSVNPALAQDKMAAAHKPAGKMAPAKKDTRASNVYVCKTCKVYYSAASAKKMGNKDSMGHKLVHADKAPVGYKDGSKMKMGGKM